MQRHLLLMFLFFLIKVDSQYKVQIQYKVGDSCNNGNGTCISIKSCPIIISNLKKGLRNYVTCNYMGVIPIVCCPKIKIKLPKRPLSKNEQKCLEYSKYSYEKESYYPLGSYQKQYVQVDKCGRTASGFIAGGEAALPREFPHMALIGYKKNPIIWACGGTLISEKHVLTAAHCVHHLSKGNAKFVRLGELDYSRDDDDAAPITINVVGRIKHFKYNFSSQYNDIGILVLEKNVEFNNYIRPACLPESNYIVPLVLATGWGQKEWGGIVSKVLQKVTLEMFSHQECNKTYYNKYNSKLVHGIDEMRQMCFGSKTEDKDTCQGDSGGPIQIVHKTIHCSYIIVGITSFGKGCAKYNIPGVYTRVAFYKSWIESIIYS